MCSIPDVDVSTFKLSNAHEVRTRGEGERERKAHAEKGGAGDCGGCSGCGRCFGEVLLVEVISHSTAGKT